MDRFLAVLGLDFWLEFGTCLRSVESREEK
jgi:hypothetical protein